jgi:hypothetical protein
MAKVTAPLFSATASGKFGEICEFRIIGSRVIAGAIKRKRAGQSAGQAAQASRFQLAAASWGAQDDTTQTAWRDLGPTYSLSGYQLYVQQYLLQGIIDPDTPTLPNS